MNLTQIYDPKTEEWGFGDSIPIPVSGAGAGVISGPKAPDASMLLEDRLTSSHLKTLLKCIFLKTIPGGLVLLCFLRSRLCVAVVDNRLYAIGGTSAAIHIGLVNNEQYTPFGYETIPEFPPGIILPLSLIVTTVVIVINGLSKSPKSFINCPFSRLANLKSHNGPSF